MADEHMESRVSGGAGSSRDGLSPEVAAEEEEKEEELAECEERQEEGEGGRNPQRLIAPHRVSKEEREAHELTHTPYRAWCRHCVKARGRNTPHRTRAVCRKCHWITFS